MQATEILRLYDSGRRDFGGENLRGQDFKGRHLSGADFSDADIRGANFTKATLTKAKFKGAKAGLQRRWAISLITFCFLLSGISGILSAFSGSYLGILLFSENHIDALAGVSTLLGLAIVLIVAIRYGLISALMALAGLATLGVAGAMVLAGRGTGAGISAFSVAMVGTALGFLALDFAASGAFIIAGAPFSIFSGVSAGVGAYAFTVFGRGAVLEAKPFAFVFACCVAGLSTYLGWHAIALDENRSSVRKIAIAFAAIGGTSFREANLTDADFSQASLKSSDLRGSNLAGTCWLHSDKLKRARLENSYLDHPKIQKLVTSKYAESQNFNSLNLEGVNLKNSKLKNCHFVGTNLNFSNLNNADLRGAILKQSQLDGADLSESNLTGTYIEDWGLTEDTILSNIQCEYVFMRVPTKNNPNPLRKPDNWKENFKENEFSDFIKPYVDTLDLYHSQDIDPRAISIALKELSQNHPESDLEIVAMEKRGSSFNLKLLTAPTANKSELNAEYFSNYDQIKSLPTPAQLLLAEKDTRIRSLENMIDTALNQPSLSIQGDLSISEDKVITISGDVAGSTLVSGDSNSVSMKPQLASLPHPENVNIQAELKVLQQILNSLNDPLVTGVAQKLAEEANKKQPDKEVILVTLEVGLTYAQTLADFPEVTTQLHPHIEATAGWIGKPGYKLLPYVGLVFDAR